MSDLCMYELEDNVWDDFGDTGDHIVPRTADEYRAQLKIQGDSEKKSRLEVIGVTSADYTNKYGILGEKEKCLHTLTKNRMLEKDPWSDIRHIPDSMFPTSGDNDPHKEVRTMASDEPRMSGHGLETGKIDSIGSDFCSDDPILVDKCATEDNNYYRFPLNHITAADDDLRFFNNNHENNKANGDLLYYGLGNFEDVDRMFRICDSTFELGSFGNEDYLPWFSPSELAEGSQDALKADAKLNSLQEKCSISRPASAANKESESKDDSTPSEQISPQEKHSKQHRASGERKDQYLENGGSLTQYGNIKQFAANSSCQLFSSSDLQRNKQNIGPDSVNDIQIDIPHMHLSYRNSSDQVSICPTLSALAIITIEKRGKPTTTNAKLAKTESKMAICEIEEVSVGNPAERESSNARESSCAISPLDEVSQEATSFRQLQQVMEKLDIRTKLCIRDSLYRLATSGKQRHNCSKMKGGIGDEKDASGSLVADETNKCTGFMDMETDTNPIDRSIAHLLFHRPSDPSQRLVIGSVSLKSHGMIHGSVTNPPPMISEKHVGNYGTDAVSSDNKPLTNCDSR
ncbi:Dentin sialophosphoprotein-related, putative isoform 2 [Hibiscus syriacus]|uniref:Dentin sialophosphoprotein-related, putative isoform 2 n=1 Tax=Hibiscus syriacus TaxID=106335 RepID=A0A6A2Z5E7_HIBSY|nr:Dentin sialophosphoprotein-related, putative isoform 2 [Hibiscus syriacus]